MEKIIIYIFILLVVSAPAFSKDVYVNGYTRGDGTHVQGHYRSAPDSTVNNNFSTEGNVNPYTGKDGWVDREPTDNLENYEGGGEDPFHNENTYKKEATPPVKENRFFDDITLSGTILYVCFLLIIAYVSVYLPYVYTKEFIQGPIAYCNKYGLEVFRHLFFGCCALITLYFFASSILSTVGWAK